MLCFWILAKHADPLSANTRVVRHRKAPCVVFLFVFVVVSHKFHQRSL